MKYLEALNAFFALHTEFILQTSSKSMRSDWQDFIATNRLPLRAYDWPEPGSFTANRLLERGTLPYTQEEFQKELREVLAFGKALPKGVGGYEMKWWCG